MAASAGLVYDPWQRDVLVPAMGEDRAGRWSAFEVVLLVPRQNGKGSILEGLTLYHTSLLGSTVIHSAHMFKTAVDAFRRLLGLFDSTPDLRRLIKRVNHSHGEEGIELRNGGRVRYMARSKGSGRGLSADLLIYDEAYALTDDHIEAQLPTLGARDNPQVWYTSSPPLDGESGLPLFGLRDRQKAGDGGLAYFDFGAAGDLDSLDEVNLDDRRLWRSSNPAETRRTLQAIARERQAMSDVGFAREIIGIWPRRSSAAEHVIDPAAWRAVEDEESVPFGDLALCVDVSPRLTHASIGLFAVRDDGMTGHVELVDYRPGVRWVVPALQTLIALHNPVAVAVDGTGPAAALLPDLEAAGIKAPDDPERPERGQLAIPTAAQRAAAYGQMVSAVTEGQVRHRNQPLLNLAVSSVKPSNRGDVEAWTRRRSAADISPLIAVTLARWAYLSWSSLVADTSYDLMQSFG